MRELIILILCTNLALGVTVSGPTSCKQGTTCTYTASAGTGPYVYSLKAGSVGSINSSTGVYTAPASITAKQKSGGCQVLPNNHIFNTKIDALPVHASNAAWMTGIALNGPMNAHPAAAFVIQETISTGSTQALTFAYTSGADGNFLVPSFPSRLQEHAEETPDLGATYQHTASTDHHWIGITKDTCQAQEVYQIYPTGYYTDFPLTNSRSGVSYALPSFTNSSGTDAAGMPLTPLTLRPSEMVAGLVSHAMRLVLANNLFNYSASPIWPAVTNGAGGASCSTCAPYGARVRLKAAYSHPAFDGICATAGCQAQFDAVILAMKEYGLIISDIGTTGEVTMAVEGMNLDTRNAIIEFGSLGITFNSTNAEFVDESTLQTNQAGTGTSSTWFEAKLGNAYVTPSDAAVVIATDSLAVAGQTSVAVQAVEVGVPHTSETILVGSAPKQFTAWSTGNDNTAVTWSLSPSGGDNGSITSEGLYTPGSPASKVQTTATATSLVDGTKTATVKISVIPAQSGSYFLSFGRPSDYTDSDSKIWYSSHKTGDFLLFDTGRIVDYSASAPWTNSGQQPTLYNYNIINDSEGSVPLSLTLPNGPYSISMRFADIQSATNDRAYSIDAQGSVISTRIDPFTVTGAARTAFSQNSIVRVTDGVLSINLRTLGGIPLVTDPSVDGFIYLPLAGGAGAFISGLSITASEPPQSRAVSGRVAVSGKVQ